MTSAVWQQVPARVVRGYGVASGARGDPRFPTGTLRLQFPHFIERGFNLDGFHPGTVNVSIAPWRYHVVCPRITLRSIKWHPDVSAEDFSFFDVRVIYAGRSPVAGLIYYPHPETKPEHFQRSDVLELVLPLVPGLAYDESLVLETPAEQLRMDME
jgi:hypothetical protein